MARNEPLPAVNGQAVKRPRKTRPKKGESQILAIPNNCDHQGDKWVECGRVASSVVQEDVTYLVKPWIPYRELTLVAGPPQTGKSSFMSWIASQAGKSAYLPGFEEDIGASTIPRLKANGADLGKVLIFDEKEYRLPRDKTKIMDAIKRWGARVLIIDPIDSYMEDLKSENAASDVREMLESAFWIAKKADAAVVGVRHPGKDPKNIMPGSRAWRAVPRSVVFLCMDASYPPKRYIIHDKDSHGNDEPPQRYLLEGKRGHPRRFVLAGAVEGAVVNLSREVSDPTDRVEVRRAGMYARRLFESTPEPLVSDWKAECAINGVSDRARRDCYRLLNIHEKPGSVGGKWIMIRSEKEWPSWTDAKQEG